MSEQSPICQRLAALLGKPYTATVPAVRLFHGREFPVGLRNAAKRLGCTPGHLWHVLKGNRPSVSLSAKYAELVVELKGGQA